jgi:hypothetical protein
MKRMVKRFGKLITASFIVMGIGIITILVTPLCLIWDIDTDIFGLLILVIGLVICIIGIIRRKKLHGIKLIVSIVLASVLSIPILVSVVSLIYYLITGKPLGD